MEVILSNKIILIVLVACLVLGYILKTWVKPLNNRYIPTVLAVAGAILGCVIERQISWENVIYGAFSGLASTGMHQAFTKCIEQGKCGIFGGKDTDE